MVLCLDDFNILQRLDLIMQKKKKKHLNVTIVRYDIFSVAPPEKTVRSCLWPPHYFIVLFVITIRKLESRYNFFVFFFFSYGLENAAGRGVLTKSSTTVHDILQ